MMKRLPILLLMLLLFILPAQAENSAFIPGSITEDLMNDAFERGDMLTLDMQFNLQLSENAEEIFGEDAAELAAVAELLDNAVLSVGAGKIDDGLRIALSGDYTKDGQSASANACIDLTQTGAALTSSLIPGEQLTAQWATLMALCGMSEEQIAQVMNLHTLDIEALMTELLAQIAPVLEMAAQIAAPYGETILTHLSALPMEVRENVPAENGYPAAAAEIQIQISAKAVGDLITALAQQLKEDATLCAILDSMLAETEDPFTTAQLCDAIIESAAESMTDETMPLNIFIGMDAAGNPLYLNIFIENEDGSCLTFNFVAGQLEETDASLVNVDLVTMNAEQEIIDGVSFVMVYAQDDADSQIMSAEIQLCGYVEGEELLTLGFNVNNAAAEDAGYAGQFDMTFSVSDGESSADASMNVVSLCAPTDSGETMSAAGTMTAMADGESFSVTFETALETNTADANPHALMIQTVKMPEYGIAQWKESYTLRAQAQAAPEALTVTAVETASPEALETLVMRALTALEQELNTLFALLPPQLLEAASVPAQ